MPSTRQCRFCGRDYVPDPRIAATQKSCPLKSCRTERRHQAQSRYVAANPDVFQGLYRTTRAWLKRHPGYLRRYQAKHQGYVAADHRSRVERRRRMRREKSDIQDTIRRQLDRVLTFLVRPALSDIQDGFLSVNELLHMK